MNKKISGLQKLAILAVIIQAGVLLFLQITGTMNALLSLVVLIVEAVVLYYAFDSFKDIYEEQFNGVRSVLGSSAQEAYLNGGIGLVIYDEKYEISWMSDLFKERNMNRIGEKLTTWLPETGKLLSGDQDTATVTLDDRVYQIRRKSDAPIMFFMDVTELSRIKEAYNKERIVIGMASFDNYDESIQYADEAETALINVAVRTPLTEYCQTRGIFIKRLNSSRYLLVLNESVFAGMMEDHFSVLNRVRASANRTDVSITLSMAFARGTSDFDELDEMVANLMDLAQTRGGDQVAVQTYGEEVKYYGGSSEAAEKRSRVRVRVMAHTLRDLIMNSSNVIIAGHKNADFDCIGSAIALAKMVQALRKPVSIIAKTGGIEEKLRDAMKKYADELNKEVSFVTEAEAGNQLRKDTLVIMTDHHNVGQSNGAHVIENANRVVVIDHHRRSTDMGVKPVLVYIEAGASSACELVTEMIPYISNRVDITELDATFMLTGMTIDTDRFHVRTGARTYEAASTLRQFGADPQVSNELLKDTFDEFNLKSTVVSLAKRYGDHVLIAPYDVQPITRSLMSQIADSLLDIQGVAASFVIAKDDQNQVCISARSAGKINVQTIMETMHGGGHMTAAAMQRSKTSVAAVYEELTAAIDTYLQEEENTDESHS